MGIHTLKEYDDEERDGQLEKVRWQQLRDFQDCKFAQIQKWG